MAYTLKKEEKYGALVVQRDFKQNIYKELERNYGSCYNRALGEARKYFQDKIPGKSKVTKVEGNVIYVNFGPYNKGLESSDDLQKDLDLQKQKFGSLMNIPISEDDDLERVTEIIM